MLCALASIAAAIPRALAQEPSDVRVDRVLHGLRPPIAIKGRPPVRGTMADRMAVHRAPGVSIAIIDEGRVIWAGGSASRRPGPPIR